jgi:hypothetical protein
MSYKPLACLYTFFHIKINNNILLKMPLNDRLLYRRLSAQCSFGAAVANIISGLPIPNAI